jgi:hypothetical protein
MIPPMIVQVFKGKLRSEVDLTTKLAPGKYVNEKLNAPPGSDVGLKLKGKPYNSALLRQLPLYPPATSTLPSVNIVAVWKDRATFIRLYGLLCFGLFWGKKAA